MVGGDLMFDLRGRKNRSFFALILGFHSKGRGEKRARCGIRGGKEEGQRVMLELSRDELVKEKGWKRGCSLGFSEVKLCQKGGMKNDGITNTE